MKHNFFLIAMTLYLGALWVLCAFTALPMLLLASLVCWPVNRGSSNDLMSIAGSIAGFPSYLIRGISRENTNGVYNHQNLSDKSNLVD